MAPPLGATPTGPAPLPGAAQSSPPSSPEQVAAALPGEMVTVPKASASSVPGEVVAAPKAPTSGPIAENVPVVAATTKSWAQSSEIWGAIGGFAFAVGDAFFNGVLPMLDTEAPIDMAKLKAVFIRAAFVGAMSTFFGVKRKLSNTVVRLLWIGVCLGAGGVIG